MCPRLLKSYQIGEISPNLVILIARVKVQRNQRVPINNATAKLFLKNGPSPASFSSLISVFVNKHHINFYIKVM